MPRRLIERCQPDSIREFRAAAQTRYHDGLGDRQKKMYLTDGGVARPEVLRRAWNPRTLPRPSEYLRACHTFYTRVSLFLPFALALAGAGNRTAAIYLWGYAAEMTLKAAYFTLFGLSPDDVITVAGQILPAINRGRAVPLYIAWPNQGAGHNILAWAELLVGVRALTPAIAYHPTFALAVQRWGQRIWQFWRATLRYHKNRAYLYEVRQTHEATVWLLANADDV